MHHTEQRRLLRVTIDTQACDLPRDGLARIDQPLNQVADIVGNLPGELKLKVVFHPRSQQFHVKAALGLPRRTLFTGDWDDYLDSALCRTMRKLRHKAAAYQAEPTHAADKVAEQLEQMNRDIVAPESPEMSAIGAAVVAGDYLAFRGHLATYEEWLRLRIGRWLQRYPKVEAEVGRRLKICDLVEEVILNAFERYEERGDNVPLHEWLDSLLDPSLRAYWQHPIEERENISFVRSLATDTMAKPPATMKSRKTPNKRSPTRAAKTNKKRPRKWSGKIHTVSTFPPEGTFNKDAKSVARIMASKKGSPQGIGSGIRMITMYINRAGKNLEPAQKRELEKAKDILHEKVQANGKRKPAGRKTSKKPTTKAKSARRRATAKRKKRSSPL